MDQLARHFIENEPRRRFGHALDVNLAVTRGWWLPVLLTLAFGLFVVKIDPMVLSATVFRNGRTRLPEGFELLSYVDGRTESPASAVPVLREDRVHGRGDTGEGTTAARLPGKPGGPARQGRGAARAVKLGIFGGTFDPPHTGHLIVAQDALISLGLDRIVFVPALVPPHKRHLSITPARLLGRVNASVRFVSWSAMLAGTLLGGLLGELVGPRATMLVGALGALPAALWLAGSPVRRLARMPAAPEPGG